MKSIYMKKNPAEIFTTIETDPNTGEYYTIIPEWIMNDMNWYEGTELRFNIDTEEVIITEKEAKQLKQDLNAYIRDGDEGVAEECANYSLIRLWLLVKKIKTNFLQRMRDDFNAECFIGNEYISGEGYVMSSKHGTYKLVDRETFSYYNFNIIRS